MKHFDGVTKECLKWHYTKSETEAGFVSRLEKRNHETKEIAEFTGVRLNCRSTSHHMPKLRPAHIH